MNRQDTIRPGPASSNCPAERVRSLWGLRRTIRQQKQDPQNGTGKVVSSATRPTLAGVLFAGVCGVILVAAINSDAPLLYLMAGLGIGALVSS